MKPATNRNYAPRRRADSLIVPKKPGNFGRGRGESLERKSYKPQPSLRVYIPKSNGKLRPLGIASYEDKIVQLSLKKILEAIYEPRFLNGMYGFGPNRGCHGAVKELYGRLNFTKICYIVDADIKGFFDHMKHGWIIKS